MLTTDQLEALEESWRRAQAPIAKSLRPGLSVDEIHSRFAEFPSIVIPRELELWWGWHDGADRARGSDVIGAEYLFFSAERAADARRNQSELYWDEVGAKHLLRWLSSSRPFLFLECGPTRQEGPCRVWGEEFAEPFTLLLSSIGDLVDLWIEAIEHKIWTYRPDGAWSRQVNGDLVDEEDYFRQSLLW